jgi:outer membrane lipoprotein-sorting protein
MKLSRALLVAAAIAAAPICIFGQAASPQLSSVLTQMDAASRNFKDATANFQCDYYERVVHDTTTQKGPVYFLRAGDAMQMGLVVMGEQNKPDRVVQYKDGTLQMFEPGVNQITVLHAGPDQAQYSEYFTLGFGGSGTALSKAWNVTDLGEDTLQDGSQQVKTDKLDLTSKNPESKTFTHITIWIDPTRALSLRQVFYLANNDKRTCNYTDVKLNGKIDMKTFEIKKNAHTSIINR